MAQENATVDPREEIQDENVDAQAADGQSQQAPLTAEEKKEQEEKRRKAEQQRMQKIWSAIDKKHKEIIEQKKDPAETEQAVTDRRNRAAHYINNIEQYEPTRKEDRIEYHFDGQDGEVHTIFQTALLEEGEVRQFFGYYGTSVDHEASLAAVLQAVDNDLKSVEVHGTEEQQELLARLAVEHGLEVSNYDVSQIKQDLSAAGVIGDAPKAEGQTAENAAQTPEGDAPKTSDETALSTNVVETPEADPAYENMRSRFYEGFERGDFEITLDDDGKPVLRRAQKDAENDAPKNSKFNDEDIVDAEFEEVVEDAPKQTSRFSPAGYLESKKAPEDSKPKPASNFLLGDGKKDQGNKGQDAKKPQSNIAQGGTTNDSSKPKLLEDKGSVPPSRRLPGPKGNKP